MQESILKFNQQFAFRPEIKNAESFNLNFKNFVFGGVGGSALSAKILKTYKPGINLYIHSDYGIPEYDEGFCKESLFIASSYSGNTEETLDFLDEAYSRGFSTFVISTGGKLLDFAISNKMPYIQIPDTKIQPRVALGFSTIALASLVLPEALNELFELENTLHPTKWADEGAILAKSNHLKVPIVYTSNSNRAIGYIWKIKINETAKIPAFHNIFPELNHNEMQSYDFIENNKSLSENFHFIFIKDSDQEDKITKRMVILEKMLESRGFSVTKIYLQGNGRFEKIFNSIILSDWFSFETAKLYGVEPEAVKMIEEFKVKLIE